MVFHQTRSEPNYKTLTTSNSTFFSSALFLFPQQPTRRLGTGSVPSSSPAVRKKKSVKFDVRIFPSALCERVLTRTHFVFSDISATVFLFCFCFFDFSHSNSISSNEKLTFFVGKFCGKFLSQYPFLSPVLRSARVVRIVRRFFFLYTQIAFSRLSKSVFWGVCFFFTIPCGVCLFAFFVHSQKSQE